MMLRGLVVAMLALALAACGGPATNAGTSGDTLQQGLAAHTAGKLDEAISLYHQVLAKDPTNKFALFNLGQIEHTKNRLVAAEAWYRLTLESDRNMTSALYNLGLVRQAVGDSVESASLLRRFIALDPNNASGHYNLGIALRSVGDAAGSNTEFQTAQRLDARLVPPAASTSPRPAVTPSSSPR
jgi:tetratricopeptide (TPR) repeat protein